MAHVTCIVPTARATHDAHEKHDGLDSPYAWHTWHTFVNHDTHCAMNMDNWTSMVSIHGTSAVHATPDTRAGKSSFSGPDQVWPCETGSTLTPMLNVSNITFWLPKSGYLDIVTLTESAGQYFSPALPDTFMAHINGYVTL